MAKSEKKTKYFQLSNTKKLPSKSEILSFITNNPNQSSKRKVAKAFNWNSDSHMWLKDRLRNLKDNYAIPQKRKNLSIKKALPSITLVKISALDKDGDFIAEPLEWTNDRKPNIRISPSHRIKGANISIGDHVLVKIFRNKVLQNFPYTGRIIRKIDKKKRNMLGIVRELENGEWQLDPIER
ncbi:MAG: ribonuclease R, partial [Bartonella sp.]|nr:ribonuclease R [Bartonella sp.]